MLYHLEIQMAGVILFTAMAAAGVAVWARRRREAAEGRAGPGGAHE